MKHFLVVVDMQNDFIDGSLGTAEALSITPAVLDKIRSFPGPVFATADTHGEDYLQTAEGRRLPIPHCIQGTPGWQFAPEISAALSERGATVVEKPSFGSLSLPRLLEEAADGEDFDVTLVGLCTDICVISNALLLKAHFPEQDIYLDPACCAGVTPAKHEAALETMRSCQIDVI